MRRLAHQPVVRQPPAQVLAARRRAEPVALRRALHALALDREAPGTESPAVDVTATFDPVITFCSVLKSRTVNRPSFVYAGGSISATRVRTAVRGRTAMR